jgi:hypothetical protein
MGAGQKHFPQTVEPSRSTETRRKWRVFICHVYLSGYISPIEDVVASPIYHELFSRSSEWSLVVE